MQTKHLKQLHDLQKEYNYSADMLRIAIECIFRRDYWEQLAEPKNRDQWIEHCLLQDDLEDLEKKLYFLEYKQNENRNKQQMPAAGGIN